MNFCISTLVSLGGVRVVSGETIHSNVISSLGRALSIRVRYACVPVGSLYKKPSIQSLWRNSYQRQSKRNMCIRVFNKQTIYHRFNHDLRLTDSEFIIDDKQLKFVNSKFYD